MCFVYILCASNRMRRRFTSWHLIFNRLLILLGFIPYIMNCYCVFYPVKVEIIYKTIDITYIFFKENLEALQILLALKCWSDEIWAHTVEDNLKLLKHFTYFKHTSVGKMTVLWKWQWGCGMRGLKCTVRKWWRSSACAAQSNWKLLKCLKCFVFPEEILVFPPQSDLNVWIVSQCCLHASGLDDHFRSLCK